MPEGAVSVCRPGKWGNDYRVTEIRNGSYWVDVKVYDDPGRRSRTWGPFASKVEASQKAVELHREKIERDGMQDVIRAELRGKDLACYCELIDPCHGDTLLLLANT